MTLSGGQRQRLALARAILTDPRILVLDDATSAVDAATEEAIHATLRELMADRTTILIAHRRSTLRLAQRIVVLDARAGGGRGHPRGAARSPARSTATCFAGPDDVDLTVGEDDLDGERGLGRRLDRSWSVDGRAAPTAWPACSTDEPEAARPRWRRRRARPRVGGPAVAAGRWGWPSPPPRRCSPPWRPLPPADDTPEVDVAAMAAPRTAEPFRVAAVRAAVDAVAAVRAGARRPRHAAHAARPGPRPRGIDQRRQRRRRVRPVAVGRACSPSPCLVDWVVVWAYTCVTGRTAERMLFGLRVKIFAHLQRLSLDYYDTRARRPDHDPDDHRRGGARPSWCRPA